LHCCRPFATSLARRLVADDDSFFSAKWIEKPVVGFGCPYSDRKAKSLRYTLGYRGYDLEVWPNVSVWQVGIIVYEWIGLGLLRRGWLNVDLAWNLALIGTGLLLLVT
jgi:hypothetical protein